MSEQEDEMTTDAEKIEILNTIQIMIASGVSPKWALGVAELGHFRDMYNLVKEWCEACDAEERKAVMDEIIEDIQETWVQQMMLEMNAALPKAISQTMTNRMTPIDPEYKSIHEVWDLEWDELLKDVDPEWETE